MRTEKPPCSTASPLLPMGEGVRRTDEGEEHLADQGPPNRQNAPFPRFFSVFIRVHPWLNFSRVTAQTN
jgi:hypothetical protein